MKISVDYQTYSTDIEAATITQTVGHEELATENKLKLYVKEDDFDIALAKKFYMADVDNVGDETVKFELTFSQLKQLSSLITQFMKQVAK